MASDDIRSAAIAAAAATLSDSAPPARSGIVDLDLAGGEHLGGQALALGAEAERRRARQRLQAVAAVGDQRRPAAPASPRPRPAPAAGAKIEPMLARTAFGEKGSAQPGPSTTVPSSRACGGADDRADVAGVADAVQVDAGRAAALGPAQRPDRDRPRARAERGDRGQQLRLDLLAAERRCRRR